jgi:hypothetical protein
MRRALFIAVLVLTVAPMGEGQKESATDAIKGRRISMNLCLSRAALPNGPKAL